MSVCPTGLRVTLRFKAGPWGVCRRRETRTLSAPLTARLRGVCRDGGPAHPAGRLRFTGQSSSWPHTPAKQRLEKSLGRYISKSKYVLFKFSRSVIFKEAKQERQWLHFVM